MTVLARCADGEEAVTAVRNHQPDVVLLDLEMPGIDGLTAAQQIAALTTDCPLTERELDALRLTREGLTVLEIATRLHLAHGTIRNYLSSGIAKTGQTRSQTRSQTPAEQG